MELPIAQSPGSVSLERLIARIVALEAAAVQGVGNSYKIDRGTATLDGSNPTPVTTGLTTVVAAVVSLKATSTPGDDPTSFSVDYSGGTLNIYAYKTNGTDPTLVASTNSAATVDWIAIGV